VNTSLRDGAGLEARPATPASGTAKAYGKLPVQFEQKQGPSRSGRDVVTRAGNYAFLFSRDGATAQLTEAISTTEQRVEERSLHGAPPKGETTNAELQTRDLGTEPPHLKTQIVKMRMVGMSPRAILEGIDRLEGKVNYFIGKRPVAVAHGPYRLTPVCVIGESILAST